MFFNYKSGKYKTEIRFLSVPELLSDLEENHKKNTVFIVDSNLKKHYKEFCKVLKNYWKTLFYQAREENKTFDCLSEIYDFFTLNRVNKDFCIYAVGGGITTDILAFAVSTYMRGCALRLIPTTLLAMVDAGIGGKTGINYKNIKNLIGSFYPAEVVFICPEFIDTLPNREIINGMAEILKVSLLNRDDLFYTLSKKYQNINAEIIETAIKKKMIYCLNDVNGESRIFLNLGHTFAHFTETASNFAISHGVAVAVGIRAAALLSLKENFIDEKEYSSINKYLDKYNMPSKLNLSESSLLKNSFSLQLDKKNTKTINLLLFKSVNSIVEYKTNNFNKIINVMTNFLKCNLY